jgi:hypothetical protein
MLLARRLCRRAADSPDGADTWSAYWYNGYVFTNDGGRGVDILKVRDRATRGVRKLPFSNPQTQLFQIR